MSTPYAVFLIQQGPFGSRATCHTLAAPSGSPDADREIKRKMERRSEQRDRTDVHRNVDFLFHPYLWRCHPQVKWVTEAEIINREGAEGEGVGEWKETVIWESEGIAVGITKWKKCWQAGCWMAGKWDNHSCFPVSRDPRDWCHCISLSARIKGVKH